MEDLWVVLLAEVYFEYLGGWCSAGLVSGDGLETGYMHRRWRPYLDFVNRLIMLACVPVRNGDMTIGLDSNSEIRAFWKTTRSR